jgi:hypothetical protein
LHTHPHVLSFGSLEAKEMLGDEELTGLEALSFPSSTSELLKMALLRGKSKLLIVSLIDMPRLSLWFDRTSRCVFQNWFPDQGNQAYPATEMLLILEAEILCLLPEVEWTESSASELFSSAERRSFPITPFHDCSKTPATSSRFRKP